MIRKSLAMFLAIALVVPALAVPAEAAKKRHKRITKRAPVTISQPAFHQAPPRMIEISPGYWVSTWGCYTDDGYGRYRSCDMREGPM
jgi:hypothetical protein